MINALLDIKENNSILKEDKVVKLPKKPMYKNMYIAPSNLFRKKPAIADPIIFTKTVSKESPIRLKFKRVKKYLKLDPRIAPITSAI